MKRRVLSLLLCFVLAAGLLSVCAPPAQAGTIGNAFEDFIEQPDQIKKLFGNEVAHGDCGPAGNEASVHYKIYEVTNPTVVQDNDKLQAIWQIHDYREDAQYYGVYIFGDGPMADYAVKGQKAPWMGNVEVTEYNDKGQKLGTTVVENLGEEYLALAYVAGATTEKWDGKNQSFTGVTNVGDRAFKDCRYLTCVFLDNNITTIGEKAFYIDEYLSAVNMPRKLECIDKAAFYGCDTLTFVRAGSCSKLKRIEDHAFYSCTMLAELRLPNCLEYIGPWAFAWDRILGQEDTTLGLPSSLRTIGMGAFAFVNHHKKLNIPSKVTTIGDYAFLCDYYMEELTFSPGTDRLTIGKAAFAGDNHMQSVDLSNRVATIDKCAFAGCEMLEAAYFGDRIDTIRARAFTSVDDALRVAIEAVLNGAIDPDNPEGNEEHASDISAALNQIAKVTKLKRAIFKNDPAKSINGAADTNRSFPADCVVYYTQGSYTWAAELKDDGTWQGYDTGYWHGDHIAQFEDTVIDPTCTKQGYTHHVCTAKDSAGKACTYAPVDDTYTAATGHTWVETKTYPSSCTAQGTVFYKCSACGATRTEKIAALGHDLSGCTMSPAATCTTAGRAVGTCARCGVKIDEVIPATGHDYDYAGSRTEPTCTEPGRITGTCPNCGQDYDEVTPALGHDWGDWVVTQAPTATTIGHRYHVCARCSLRADEDIPKLDSHTHTWDAGRVTTAPTATTPGVRTYTCTTCGATKTETIPATGTHTHTWDAGRVTTAPTATTPGVRTYTCTTCGATKTETIPATGTHTHTWDAGRVTTAPTATTPGVRTYTCTTCGATKTETIPATGGSGGCTGGPTCPSYGYTDVGGPSYWGHGGIDYCLSHGYIGGTSATTVSPDMTCTRAQIVQILYAMQGRPTKVDVYELSNMRSPFVDDVPRDAWYANAVWWAKLKGIVGGTSDTTFDPNGALTREQLALILYKYALKYAPGCTASRGSFDGFPDADSVSGWARTGLAWAVGSGLIGGVKSGGTTFLAPQGQATRAQVAVILMRFDEVTA